MKIIRITFLSLFILSCAFAFSACGTKTDVSMSEITENEEKTDGITGVVTSTEEIPSEPDTTTIAATETKTAETETTEPSNATEEPATPDSYEYYKSTIENYGNTRVEVMAGLGYTIDYPVYGYAIKDINSDGTDELVILEKTENPEGVITDDFRITAIYTLDGNSPVELYFHSRHGLYFITADGYFVYFYHTATLEKLENNQLITVAESGRMERTDGEEMFGFLQQNRVSADKMEFDYIPYNG